MSNKRVNVFGFEISRLKYFRWLWFLSIALRIPTAHDFRFIGARKWVRARTQRKRFPQAKIDSEINVPFLINMHGDLNFLSQYTSVHNILYN